MTDNANEKPSPTPTLTLAHPAEAAPRVVSTPLDALADIAARLRDASTLLASAADDLEAVALTIEESKATTDENVNKLRQLQQLLKSLSLA